MDTDGGKGEYPFSHEQLDVYRLALEVTRWIRRLAFAPRDAALQDQAMRAAQSMVLNIAEGTGHPRGRASRNHYAIARGSAAELAAVLDLLGDIPEVAQHQQNLRRVSAMLQAMSRHQT